MDDFIKARDENHQKHLVWLAGLKKGDRVVWTDGDSAYVTHVTGGGGKFVIVNDTRFNRQSGRYTSSCGFHFSWILPMGCEEAKTRLAHHMLKRTRVRVNNLKFNKLDMDTLLAILELVPKSLGGNGPDEEEKAPNGPL